MVDSCCAPGCQNKRGDEKGRAFYRIPKEPERRYKWITAIKRARSDQKKSKRWEPSTNGFRLCSEHFISGKKSDNPMSPDYVPSIFEHVPSSEKKRRRMQLELFNRRQKRRLQRIEQESNNVSRATVISNPQDQSSDEVRSDEASSSCSVTPINSKSNKCDAERKIENRTEPESSKCHRTVQTDVEKPQDCDEYYFMTLVKMFKKLPPHKKAEVRMKMERLLFEAEFQ